MKYLILLAAVMTASSAFATDKDKVLGLICDQETPDGRDTKIKIEITVKGETASLQFRNAQSITGFAILRVEARAVEPILDNDLAKMNKMTLVDRKNGSEIAFKVDGYTFDQKPRLGALARLKGEEDMVKLTSCLAEISRPYRPY